MKCPGTGSGRTRPASHPATRGRRRHRGLVFRIDAKRADDLWSRRRVDVVDEHDVRIVERDFVVLNPRPSRDRIEANPQAHAALGDPLGANHRARPRTHAAARPPLPEAPPLFRNQPGLPRQRTSSSSVPRPAASTTDMWSRGPRETPERFPRCCLRQGTSAQTSAAQRTFVAS